MYLDPSLGADHTPTAAFNNDDQQWVRLIPPGVDDSSIRLPGPATNLLEPLIKELLFRIGINGIVDILTYSGWTHQEYLLRIQPGPDASSREIAGSVMVGNEHEFLLEENINYIPSALGPYVASRLMDRMGVEIVQCDLAPLGESPAPTTRLLSTTESEISLTSSPDQAPFGQYLEFLASNGMPHLARLRIGTEDQESYHIEQQVAFFADWPRSLDLTELAQLLTSDLKIDIAEHYETSHLSSLIQLLADSDWELPAPRQQPDGVRPSLRLPHSATQQAATDIKRLLTRGVEYDWLRGELDNSIPIQPAYKKLSGRPTLTVPADQLSGLLGYAPNYDQGQQLWTDNRREVPRLEQRAVLRSARETRHTHPTDQSTTTAASEPSAVTQHVPEQLHDLAQCGWRRLTEHGDVMTTIEDPVVPGVAYHRQPPSGSTHPVIVGTKSSLRPGDIVAAASARKTDHLTVVTDTKADARWIAEVLREPVIQMDGGWTQLYPLLRHYCTRNNLLALVPRTDEPIRWWYSTEGKAELRVGEEVVLAHQNDEPIGTEVDEVHWGLVDTNYDSPYRIQRPDGTLEAFDDAVAVGEQYGPVCLCAPLASCSYLHAASIYYRENQRLRPHSPQLPTGELDRFSPEQSIQSFVNTYTCRRSGESISGETFINAFQRYLYPQATQHVPDKKTIRSTLLSAGTAINPDTISHQSSARQPVTLPRRAWQYPLRSQDPRTLAVANIKDSLAEFGDALMQYILS